MNKTRENLGFFGWHLFCQHVLEAPPGISQCHRHCECCEPDSAAIGGRAKSDGGVCESKKKNQSIGLVFFLGWVDRKDATCF